MQRPHLLRDVHRGSSTGGRMARQCGTLWCARGAIPDPPPAAHPLTTSSVTGRKASGASGAMPEHPC